MSKKSRLLHSTHIEICPFCRKPVEVENTNVVLCPICGNEFNIKKSNC